MMTLKKKILAAAFVLSVGTSIAIPTIARADDWWRHHDRDDRSWQARDHDHDRDWKHWDHDHDRDWKNWDHDRDHARYIPPNGEGMINNRNPNLYWACDSAGHHCHWARR